MAEKAPAGRRLQRLLTMVPYIVRRGVVPIAELAETFGASPEEILRDVNLLLWTGSPPYTPDVLIDVIVEDDEVRLRLADTLAKPLRLTRTEAVSLYLRGAALAAGLADDAPIATALAKLAAAFGDDTLRDVAAAVETAPHRVPDALAALRDAAARHERVRIEYHAASTGETTHREIEPEEVFLDAGNWYVVAWDLVRDAERLFRVDRVSAVEPIAVTFAPRGLAGAGRDLYTPGLDDVVVRLRLSPAARWVADYYELASAEEDGEGLVVTFPAGRLEWVARLLLRLGPDAEVLEPAALPERVRALAGSTLERYGVRP